MGTGDVVLLYVLWFILAFGLAVFIFKKAS